MLYKTLGFAVWKGAKWYLARKAPGTRVIAGLGVGALAATAAALGAKRTADAS